MLNNIKHTDLFCDYYERWVAVYKEGAIRKVTWINTNDNIMAEKACA